MRRKCALVVGGAAAVLLTAVLVAAWWWSLPMWEMWLCTSDLDSAWGTLRGSLVPLGPECRYGPGDHSGVGSLVVGPHPGWSILAGTLLLVLGGAAIAALRPTFVRAGRRPVAVRTRSLPDDPVEPLLRWLGIGVTAGALSAGVAVAAIAGTMSSVAALEKVVSGGLVAPTLPDFIVSHVGIGLMGAVVGAIVGPVCGFVVSVFAWTVVGLWERAGGAESARGYALAAVAPTVVVVGVVALPLALWQPGDPAIEAVLSTVVLWVVPTAWCSLVAAWASRTVWRQVGGGAATPAAVPTELAAPA